MMNLLPPPQLSTQVQPMENQEINLIKAKIIGGLLQGKGNTNVYASSSYFSSYQGTNGPIYGDPTTTDNFPPQRGSFLSPIHVVVGPHQLVSFAIAANQQHIAAN